MPWTPMRSGLAISACVTLNVFLFFKPITKLSKASTYPPLRLTNRYITEVIDGVGGLERGGQTHLR